MKKAILIGINESIGKETLNNAVSDVRLLAALLPHLGFNEIITLDTVETTTKECILATLMQLNDFDSDVLLWISSHGSSLHRQFFIHCSDGGVLSEGDILKYVPSSYRNSILTAFDCCRTEVDNVPDNKRHSSIDDLDLCNLDVHYSTTYGNEAFDGKDHSPFTQAFLAAICSSYDGSSDKIFSLAANIQDIRTEGEQRAECKMLNGRRFRLYSHLCDSETEDLLPSPYFLDGIDFAAINLEGWGDLVKSRTKGSINIQNAIPHECLEALTTTVDIAEEFKHISTLNRAVYEMVTSNSYSTTRERFEQIREDSIENKNYFSFISAYIVYLHILEAKSHSDAIKCKNKLEEAIHCVEEAASKHSTVYLLRLLNYAKEYSCERFEARHTKKQDGAGKHRRSVKTSFSKQSVLSRDEFRELQFRFLRAEKTIKAGLQPYILKSNTAAHSPHRFEVQRAQLADKLLQPAMKTAGVKGVIAEIAKGPDQR